MEGGKHFVQWWRVAPNWAETLRITGAQQRAGLPSLRRVSEEGGLDSDGGREEKH